MRFNYSYPLLEDMKGDIGSKTDVLYHCLCLRNDSEEQAVNKLFIEGALSELSCLALPGDGVIQCKQTMGIAKRLLHAHPIAPIYFYSPRLIKRTQFDCPTVGIVAIQHILDCGAEEVFITGFTVHQDRYYQGYNDNHPDLWKNGPPQNLAFHKVDAQKKFLQNKLQHPAFNPDDVLRRVLE